MFHLLIALGQGALASNVAHNTRFSGHSVLYHRAVNITSRFQPVLPLRKHTESNYRARSEVRSCVN
jgi:hypothetical protein